MMLHIRSLLRNVFYKYILTITPKLKNVNFVTYTFAHMYVIRISMGILYSVCFVKLVETSYIKTKLFLMYQHIV